MTTSPPVLLTCDDLLSAEVLRLAAAAGAGLEVVGDAAAALRTWGSAGTVLVGADQVATVAASRPPRRPDVHVIAHGTAPDELFRGAVALGAASVLELPAADGWLGELLTDLADQGRHSGLVIAVTGASGGVGATVLSAALALTAARQGPAALLDLDPFGPGMRRVVGFDDVHGITWRELGASEGRLGARALREALPTRAALGVLSWPDQPEEPPSPSLIREVVSAAGRGHDWVVVDVPRSLHALLPDLVAWCDRVLLVTRASVGSVAATARVAATLGAGAPTAVVLRRGRGAILAEDVSRALGLPVVAELRDQRRLEEHLDLGVGPVHQRHGPLARTAARLVALLDEGR